MAAPQWVHETLDEHRIAYENLHHAEAYTAQELAHREHCSGHHVAKVVVAIADGVPLLVVVPASRHVLLEEVRTALDAAEVRLATEAEIAKTFPGCELGAVPPLRHWGDVAVLMDHALETSQTIVFTAGTRADAIRVRFYDWYRLVNPLVGLFSEPDGSH
jgi:Ala-tRNA(Pro) deacylase